MEGKEPQSSIRMFEETLNYLQEAVVVFDKDERLIIFNEEYAELFESVESALVPGVTARELATEALFSGKSDFEAKKADHNWFDLELSDFRAATGRPCLRRTQNGRFHSVVYSPDRRWRNSHHLVRHYGTAAISPNISGAGRISQANIENRLGRRHWNRWARHHQFVQFGGPTNLRLRGR